MGFLFVNIIRLFCRQVCFISKGLVGVTKDTICSRHDIAEILLRLTLNINQLVFIIQFLCHYVKYLYISHSNNCFTIFWSTNIVNCRL